ncbi:hypothetical protein N9H39_08270 [Gammaproteobacteria bacterium]|nr:hypothetical protein [Gammaproteobacteria bacterium]
MLQYIMGLLNTKKTVKPTKGLAFTLGTDEIRIILQGIQNSTYKGKDIEMMYNLVLKLQNLYTKSLDNK